MSTPVVDCNQQDFLDEDHLQCMPKFPPVATGWCLQNQPLAIFLGLHQVGCSNLAHILFVHFLPIEAYVLIQWPPILLKKPLHPDEGFKMLHFAPKDF